MAANMWTGNPRRIASGLQSRLAKRGSVLRDMEADCNFLRQELSLYDSNNYAVRMGYKQLRKMRDDIKPIARDQKLDREALAAVHELMRVLW